MMMMMTMRCEVVVVCRARRYTSHSSTVSELSALSYLLQPRLMSAPRTDRVPPPVMSAHKDDNNGSSSSSLLSLFMVVVSTATRFLFVVAITNLQYTAFTCPLYFLQHL